MATFREYIASLGAAGAVPEAELDELLGRYEWFALARLVRLRQRGGDPSEDGRLGFAVQDRAAGTAPEVDRERLTALCADDLIDDFQLYLYIVRLAALVEHQPPSGPDEAARWCQTAAESYRESGPGARDRVARCLHVILTAYLAGRLKQEAEALLAALA